MAALQEELMARARKAQDQLAGRWLDHPDVSLIDIGSEPAPDGRSRMAVLRVHIRPAASREALDLPAEIDGIPVRVITADYRLE